MHDPGSIEPSWKTVRLRQHRVRQHPRRARQHLRRGAVAAAVAALAFGASAQQTADDARRGRADAFFAAVPSTAPADLLGMDGQAYVQALPAVGREDLHARLAGRMSVAQPCPPIEGEDTAIAERIAALAGATEIVIVNEAHDEPRHRAHRRARGRARSRRRSAHQRGLASSATVERLRAPLRSKRYGWP